MLSGGRWKGCAVARAHRKRSTITGFHVMNGWAKERYLLFRGAVLARFDDTEIISSGKPVIYNTYRFRSRFEGGGDESQFFAKYRTVADEVIQVKVAVSPSVPRMRYRTSIPKSRFGILSAFARRPAPKWDRELSTIQIEGSQTEKETFYTALYHAFRAQSLSGCERGYRGF